jgi:phage tail sheath gpL-like
MSGIAVDSSRISKVVGYKIIKGNFNESTQNLPQRIAVIVEANTDNQEDLDLTPWVATTAKATGDRYGYGSPAHILMRILRPAQGDGVGGIPIVIYPQAEADGATEKIYEVTPTGVATGNGVHTVVVAGRYNLDFRTYDINIVTGDSTAEIADKIKDAVNNTPGCPLRGTSTDYAAELSSKWKGKTAEGVTLSVDTNENDLGITYVVESTQAGSGIPDISDALTAFGTNWNTIVLNSYGTESSIMSVLESANGIPDPDNPTGRYAGLIMKPFIALTGSVANDPSSITDARDIQVTIAICPAPLSAGLAMEAAANMCVLYARQAQDEPHLDVSGRSYPDMPTPDAIGDMAVYDNRDVIVKKGCSTVDLVNQRYQVMDFVTTYHPEGEEPPQFRYCRNLNIDFNVRFGYYLLEQINVVDHAIANDTDQVSASKVIKPKIWKGILFQYALDLADRALIVDSEFMKQSLVVVKGGSNNPDRMDTSFRYKRSPYTRISSTVAEAGFSFA